MGRAKHASLFSFCRASSLFRDDDDRMAAMFGEKREPFRHPRLESGRRVLVDLADDVFAVAQPAEMGKPLAENSDLAAILARETVSQGRVRRRSSGWPS